MRASCYDSIARSLGLRVAELPSHYSEEALSGKPKEGRPDCSQLSQLLFGIEMGGPRSYLDELPRGLVLGMPRPTANNMGRDSISGMTHGLPLRNAGIIWNEDRVSKILASFSSEYPFELDIYFDYIESLMNTDFLFMERSENYGIGCENKVSINVSRADIGGGRNRPPIYLLSLLFEYHD